MKKRYILGAAASALALGLVVSEDDMKPEEKPVPVLTDTLEKNTHRVSEAIKGGIQKIVMSDNGNYGNHETNNTYTDEELRTFYTRAFKNWRSSEFLKDVDMEVLCESLKRALLTEGNIRALDFLELIALHKIGADLSDSELPSHEQFQETASENSKEVSAWIEEHAGISSSLQTVSRQGDLAGSALSSFIQGSDQMVSYDENGNKHTSSGHGIDSAFGELGPLGKLVEEAGDEDRAELLQQLKNMLVGTDGTFTEATDNLRELLSQENNRSNRHLTAEAEGVRKLIELMSSMGE